jgi:hypothetical protein
MQYVNRNEVVAPSYIQGAVTNLDNMYKVAACVALKDITADAATDTASTAKKVEKKPDLGADTVDPDIIDKDKVKNAEENAKGEEKEAESVAEELGIVKEKTCDGCKNPISKCTCKGGKKTAEEIANEMIKEALAIPKIPKQVLTGVGIGAAAGAIKGAVGKKDEDESRTGKILKNVAVGGVLGAAAGKGVKNFADGRAMKANQGLSQHLYNTKENPLVKQKLLTAEEMSEEMVKEAMHKKGFRTVSLKKDECEGEPEKNYHSASEELEDLLKEAKMTVPDKKEAKKEQIPPDKQVASADPTDGEYLADIDCKECQYKGKPASDGTCPNCGALLGEKPKEKDNEVEKPVGHNNQTQRSIEDTIAAHDSGNSMDSVD